jgi:Spy/CpxP family protein refolding chaperone
MVSFNTHPEMTMRLPLTMLGALLATGIAVAQTTPPDAPPPPPEAGQPLTRIDRLAILLDLTDSQRQQVQQILEQQRQQMKAYWQQQQSSGTKPDFQQLRAQREQLRQQTLAQLQPLLSADQYKKLEVLMTPPAFGRRHHHGPPPGGSSESSSSAGE